MSSFNDAAFRSQQMLAPYQMQGAMNKTAGIQRIGDAAVQAAGMWNQSQNNAAEMALRTAEAGTKIAAWQQEQELNAYKLQNLMAIDQAVISRTGASIAELKAKSMELKYNAEKKAYEGMDVDTAYKTAQAKSKLMDMAIGLPDMVMGDDGMPRKGTKEERAAFEDSYKFREQSQRGEPTVSPAMRKYNDLSLQLSRYNSYLANPLSARDPEAVKHAQEMAKALRPAVRQAAIEAGIQMDEQEAGTPSPTTGEPRGALSTTDDGKPVANTKRRGIHQRSLGDDARAYVRDQAAQSQAWKASPVWSRLNVDDETRDALSQGISAYADALLSTQQQNGRDLDLGMVHEQIMAQAERSPVIMGMLLAFASKSTNERESNEEIRMQLRTLFPEANIDATMKQINSYITTMLGDRR